MLREITLKPTLNWLRLYSSGKNLLGSLFHNATVLMRNVSEWNFVLTKMSMKGISLSRFSMWTGASGL